MISILTKGRDIPRDGCGGHPGGEQCFSDLYGVKNQDFVIVPELGAGGKPQPGFRRGRLVEQSPFQNQNEPTDTKSSRPTGFL